MHFQLAVLIGMQCTKHHVILPALLNYLVPILFTHSFIHSFSQSFVDVRTQFGSLDWKTVCLCTIVTVLLQPNVAYHYSAVMFVYPINFWHGVDLCATKGPRNLKKDFS